MLCGRLCGLPCHWRADNGHFRKNKVHNTGCRDPVYSYFFSEIFSSLTVYPFFETLFTAAPGKLLQINELIEGVSMYTGGGEVFGAVYILIPLYAVIFCVLVPILYRIYKRQR